MPWEKTDMGEQRAVCGAGREREGTDERSVSGAWRFTADGDCCYDASSKPAV